MHPRRRAFTLIELLVVIGIIAVLISILFPTLARSREAANRVQCASNMRQIGAAILAYSIQNKGRAPYKGGPKEYPYEWNKTTLMNPLMRYGLNLKIMTCPSMELFNPPFDAWTGHMGTDDILVNYQYLVGLADPETIKSGFAGKWYETDPTAAPYTLTKARMKIMLVDMNLFFAATDNGFNNTGSAKWLYSSHALRNKFNPDLVDLRRFVKGSNRLYNDGHVKWALPEELGRDDKPITTDITAARYSHSGDSRPYYW